eukprot:CAMPEP_0179163940 /NCGR_PEP_ID=MMETSP0796-20121207/80418_1 /TAXON_ID=73915 /ORGANISM="Pyrodinium bahamense, Strain pbaha01" /LENGTH=226 /DNA_ID=CAMNT_0020866325 /DNA_START=462 /DNA_END=1139 /DNA_ORIENTATION=+
MTKPIGGLVHVCRPEAVRGDDVHALLNRDLQEANTVLEIGGIVPVREASVHGFAEATWRDGHALLQGSVARAAEDGADRVALGVRHALAVHLTVKRHEAHGGSEAEVDGQAVQGPEPSGETTVVRVRGGGSLLAAQPVEPGAAQDAMRMRRDDVLLVGVIGLPSRANEAWSPTGAKLDGPVHGGVPSVRAPEEVVEHQGLAHPPRVAAHQQQEARHMAVTAHALHD